MKVVVGILVLSGYALGQGQVSNALVNQMLDVQSWMSEFSGGAMRYQAQLSTLAGRLAVLGTIVGGLKLMLSGNTQLNDVLTRVIFASALLGLAPSLSTGATSLWESARVEATANLTREYEQAAKEFARVGAATTDILVTSALYTAVPGPNVGPGAGIKSKAISKITGSEAYETVRDKLAMIGNLVIPLLMVSVLMMFFLLIMSGIAIVLASVILPLAAGLLTFPGGLGMSLLGSYVRVTLSSILLVLLFPIIMAAVFDLTAHKPATHLANQMEANKGNIDAMVQSIDQDTSQLGVAAVEKQLAGLEKQLGELERNPAKRKTVGPPMPVALRPWTAAGQAERRALQKRINTLKDQRQTALDAYEARVATTMTNGLTQLGRDVQAWVTTILVLIVCMILSIFALFKFEGYVATLVGGLVLGAGGAVSTILGALGLIAGTSGAAASASSKAAHPVPLVNGEPVSDALVRTGGQGARSGGGYRAHAYAYNGPALERGNKLGPGAAGALGSGPKALPPGPDAPLPVPVGPKPTQPIAGEAVRVRR